MPQSKDNYRQGHDKIFYLSEVAMSLSTNSCPNGVAKKYYCNNTTTSRCGKYTAYEELIAHFPIK